MITIYRILCHFFKEVISHFYYLNMAENGDLNVRTSQGNLFYGTFFPQSSQTPGGQKDSMWDLGLMS